MEKKAENSEEKKIFARRLNNLIEEKNITNVSNASTEIGLDKETLGKYLVGETFPGEKILKLAKYFNVSTSYLLGETDIRNADNKEIANRFGIDENTIMKLEEIKKINDEYKNSYNDVLKEIFLDPSLYKHVLDNLEIMLKYYLDDDYKQEINEKLRIGKKIFNYKKMEISDYIEISLIEKFLQEYNEYMEFKMMQEGALGRINYKRLEDEIKLLEKKIRKKKYILKKVDNKSTKKM